MTNNEKIVTNVSETLLSQLYNREVKETFLRDYLEDENTRLSYAVFLVQCAEYENLIGKDMYLWSSKDILDMFGNKFTSSHTSLRALFTIAKQYLNWSTERGFNTTGSNPFQSISFKNDILPMLNTKGLENKFLTEEQVWAMEDVSRNYQDFACLVPLFYSVRGSKASELQKLKESDVDSINNTLTLTDDDGSVRILEVSPRLIQIFKNAIGEDIYNRRGREGFGQRTTCNLIDSEYVLRPTTVKGDGFVTAQTISSRCKKLLTECGYPNLSVNDVFVSGKIHALQQIEKQKNEEVDIEDYKKVQSMFNEDSANYANLKQIYELYKSAISKAE